MNLMENLTISPRFERYSVPYNKDVNSAKCSCNTKVSSVDKNFSRETYTYPL